LLTGLCEIGGGYFVWLWLKEGKPFWYGLLGGFILVLYGVVATLQTSNFARVYATYGGVFIVMSLLWAYKFDNYCHIAVSVRRNPKTTSYSPQATTLMSKSL